MVNLKIAIVVLSLGLVATKVFVDNFEISSKKGTQEIVAAGLAVADPPREAITYHPQPEPEKQILISYCPVQINSPQPLPQYCEPIHSPEPQYFYCEEPEICYYEDCCSNSCCNDFALDTFQVIFGAAFGDYIGIRHGYSELGFFTSVADQEDHHIFVDARQFNLHHNDWAGSIGTGLRAPICNAVLGANIYYDHLSTRLNEDRYCDGICNLPPDRKHVSFNRLGLGAEFLSCLYDARVNGYIPLGKTYHSGNPVVYNLGDGFVAEYRNNVFLRWGVDGEVGTSLFKNDCFSSYVAVGGYYYDNKNLDSYYGPQARAEVWWKNYASLQFYYTYDHENQSQYMGKILFSIPLEDIYNCFCGQSCCCDPGYNQLVRRNYIPFVDRSRCWKWNW